MAGNYSPSELDSELLMVDPFLDYINEILMHEGHADDHATYMQRAVEYGPSYHAIFSDFYNILGAHSTPAHLDEDDSAASCPAVDALDPHPDLHLHGPADEHHVQVIDAYGLHLAGSRFLQQEEPLKSTEITEPHEQKNGSSFNNSRSGFNQACVSNLSSDKVSVAKQYYHSAFQFNDGVLMDSMVCCRGGTGNFKLPSADEEFLLKLTEVDLLFEDLKLEDVYTSLYVEQPPISSTRGATNSKHNGGKKKSLAGKGSMFGRRITCTPEVESFVDVKEALLSCAQAVAIGDVRKANKMLQEIHQLHGASADGTGLQRTAHMFSKALAARMRGTGPQELRAVPLNTVSAATALRISKLSFEVLPFVKAFHYFANQSILKAAEGASRLHIVDYGLMHGIQWPCLINALADRRGGPPLLVITGVEYPQPGINMVGRLDESGRRLAAYAKTFNVPFQYQAVVSNKWEDVDAASLHCHESEVLVVNCNKRLRHLADDSAESAASTISPRQKFLAHMHSLNPQLLVVAVVSAAINSPFFVSRFREALYHYSNKLDILETLWGEYDSERLLVERGYCYRDIVNIVACEGAERVERPETYRQWHARITQAGFQHLPIPATILSSSKSHVKQHYHKDFLMDEDAINGWMLMGWKGRTTLAFSAWKPAV